MNKNNLSSKRIGETSINKDGDIIKIIEYIDANHIKVEVQNKYKDKICTNYYSFKNHTVKNSHRKDVCNIGYIGNTSATINGKKKYSYSVWNNMIRRCYDTKEQMKTPTYKGCTVCDEWLCYENFEKWFNENYYEIPNQRMNLDKDILLKGNKIYSPLYCRIVSQEINILFIKSNKKRGRLPIGVSVNNKKFKAQISLLINNKKVLKGLGTYDTPQEAFKSYKKAKERYIKFVADKYKKYIPLDIYNAMYEYEVEITD